MADKTWHTYAEAAQALGLSVEGVRQRARREHWRKMLGNDGKALVMLPEDAERLPAVEAPSDQAGDKQATRRQPGKQPPEQLEFITGLQNRINELRADLEREREERLAERQRADKATNDLAETAREMARMAGEGAQRESNLRQALADLEQKVRDQAEAERSRRWWQFRRSA